MFKACLLLIVLCVVSSGCLWSSHGVRKDPERVKTMGIQVLRDDLLAKGGTVLVEPFPAGAEAEATPEMDRFSLLIVKGVADALGNGGGGLVYKDPNSSGDADFVIEGHIEKFKVPGTMDRMRFRNKATIGTRGNLKDLRSGEVVALIYDQRKSVNDPKDLELTAYAIGADMARELAGQGARP